MHEPKEARGTNLRAAIAVGLDEALTALEESFVGLRDEQFWAFPVANRCNVVTLVEHCIQCLDLYGCEVQGAPLLFEPEERFDIFHFTVAELKPLLDDLPGVARERERVTQLRAAVMDVLERVSDEELSQPRHGCWWFDECAEYADRTRADAYMRCIWHTMAHVRQIWYLRGVIGVTDEKGWPHQHWA